MQVSGYHAPAASAILMEWGALWAPEPTWTVGGIQNSRALAGNRTMVLRFNP